MIQSYREFWPFYLREHAKQGNRVLHYLGYVGAGLCLLGAVAWSQWWLVPTAVLAGYGSCWIGHFVVEGNKPATLGHPLWSIRSYGRMTLFALSGRLRPELERAQRKAS